MPEKIVTPEPSYKVIFAAGGFKLVETDPVGKIRETSLGTPQEMFAVQVFDGVSHVTDGETKVAACSSYFLPERAEEGPYGPTVALTLHKSKKF